MKLFLTLGLILFSGLAAFAQRQLDHPNVAEGVASYYHEKFVGRPTANGEVFDNRKFTAASNRLKLGSYVKVTNKRNGKYVYVRINDRMCASNRREIDLASIAARQLGFVSQGLTKVIVEIVPKEEGKKGILAQIEQGPPVRTNEL